MPMEREQIGACTLDRGDCYALLPDLAVDCVLTDPPFSATTHAGARGGGFGQNHLVPFGSMGTAEAVALAQQLCGCAQRWVVMSVDWHHATAIEQALPSCFIRAGIWIKPNGAPQFTGDRPGMGWESIVILHRPGRKQWNGGGQHAVWHIPKIAGRHPTEKPLALIRAWVEQFSHVGETLLDPFMGSGTTGVACVQLGRTFVGVEIERRYFDIACQRIEDAYKQLSLFPPEMHSKPRQEVLF